MAANGLLPKSGRDGRVELLRVLACLMVVALHAKSNTFVEGVPVYPRVLFSCFVSDAVAVFWLIMGFYLFKPRPYKSRILHCLHKIILPMLLFTLFLIIFPVFNGESLNSSLLYSGLVSILLLEPQIPLTGHFWFLFVYAVLVLIYPVLDAVRARFLSDSKGRRRFLLAVLCLFAFNDLTINRFLRVDQIPITALIPSALIVLSGYAVYEERQFFQENKHMGVVGFTLFVAANLLRSVLTYLLLRASSANTHLLYWCSSFGFIASLGLSVFFFSLKRKDGALSQIAALLGSCTMVVYIIHPWLISMGLNVKVAGIVCNGAETFDQYIIFVVCMTLAVFVIGAVVSLPFSLIKRLVMSLVSRSKKTEESSVLADNACLQQNTQA